MSNHKIKTAALLLSSAVLLISIQANASDLIEAQSESTANWEGAYLGFHGSWGSADTSMKNLNPPGPPSRTNDLDLDGFGGGVQIGYNWQLDNYVFGVIGDYTFTNLDGSKSYPGGGGVGGPAYRITSDIDWVATLRGKLGYLVQPETLLYAHGGFAWADVSGTWTSQGGGGGGGGGTGCGGGIGPWCGKGGDTLQGYVVGAGIEHMITANMTGFIEYSWMDLGDYKFVGNSGTPRTFKQDVDLQMVKFGLNFKF